MKFLTLLFFLVLVILSSFSVHSISYGADENVPCDVFLASNFQVAIEELVQGEALLEEMKVLGEASKASQKATEKFLKKKKAGLVNSMGAAAFDKAYAHALATLTPDHNTGNTQRVVRQDRLQDEATKFGFWMSVRDMNVAARDFVSSIISPDGQDVLTLISDNKNHRSAMIFDIHSGVSRELENPDKISFFRAKYSPDSSKIYAGGVTHFQTYDAKTGRLMSSVRYPKAFTATDLDYNVQAGLIVGVLKSGDAVTEKTELVLYDFSGLPLKKLPLDQDTDSYIANFKSIVISPDGKTIAAVLRCQTGHVFIRVWDVASSETYDIETPRFNMTNVVFHPDQKHFFIGMVSGEVKKYSIASKTVVSEFKSEILSRFNPTNQFRFFPSMNGIAINSDGTKILTTANDLFVRIWNSETGEKIEEFQPHDATKAEESRTATFGADDQVNTVYRLKASVWRRQSYADESSP